MKNLGDLNCKISLFFFDFYSKITFEPLFYSFYLTDVEECSFVCIKFCFYS